MSTLLARRSYAEYAHLSSPCCNLHAGLGKKKVLVYSWHLNRMNELALLFSVCGLMEIINQILELFSIS